MKNKPVVAIVGAGRMGTGIAQVFAYAGNPVRLIDIKQRAGGEGEWMLKQAADQIANSLELFCSMGVINKDLKNQILGRVSFYTYDSLSEVLSDADVIFEAVPELLEIKEVTFRLIGSAAHRGALVASTTSTFSVDMLAEFIEGPERFMNTHWLNPAYLIPLVEVSPAAVTNEEKLNKMLELLKLVGKVPVKCSPSPGFIVPRIQALAMNEAARMYEEGVASAEEIDKAIKVGFGIRFAVLGLLEFIDWGGGDILFYASRYLKDTLGSDKFSPPDVIIENMEKGNIGMKSGKGFYDFSCMDVSDYQRGVITRFAELLKFMGLFPEPGGSNRSRP